MSARHFLFLQGLPGPAFRLIARELERGGHRTSRINFNGGDLADWRFGGASYRGSAEDFGRWLERHVAAKGISDLVLLGEWRPLHRAAIALAARAGLDVHVFEEGYLRPHSVAIERWRAGQAWRAPATLEACRALASGPAREEVPIENRFARRWRESVLYWIWATALWPLYPRFRSHRVQSAGREMLAWLGRYARRNREYRESEASLAVMGSAAFMLFPLQLDGDAQLDHRSPFADMEAAVDLAMASFARHAPQELHLLVKRHPFDPDPRRWRRRVTRLAARHGLIGRVHYIEFGDLDRLIAACRGVITVNSTVGGLALRAGKPVHTLGQAHYAMPGLAGSGPPDTFWTAPQPPADGAFATYAAALWNDCLVNAGFHGKDALARLSREAAARMTQP